MAIIKCKMCGGNLTVVEGETVCECEYCGTRQTVPSADNEKKLTLFSRAGRLLRSCEFDKAAGVFESIVADFPEEAEAYWGLVLCKYGIEYVDDPLTGKKIPTCHRSSFDSVLDDANFEQACENTDAVARRIYRDEARQIEDLRQSILQVSGKEEPYDIFISYKETGADGERTLDSVIAQDIYKALTAEGYRVFFSRISLENRLGTEYEPYIFAALNSAKVMIVVGTDYENFDAVWVKNEWSRFLKLIAAGQRKTLIPVFKNMDPYDMPKEFAKLQAQDMGKIGAMQDLMHGVEKLIPKKAAESASTSQITYTTNETDAKTAAAVKRGMLALEEGSWDKAKQYFEHALSFDAECAAAYFGMALSSAQCHSSEKYIEHVTTRKAEQQTLTIPQQTEHIKEMVKTHVIPRFLDESEIQKQYQNFNLTYTSTANGHKKILSEEKSSFENNRMFSLAFRFAKDEYLKKLESFKHTLFTALEDNVQKAQQEEQTSYEQKTQDYKAFLEWADKKVEDIYQKKLSERENEYQLACSAFTAADTISKYRAVKERFQNLANYKDSAEYIKKSDAAVAQLEAKEKRDKEIQKKEDIYKSCQRVFSGTPSEKDLQAAQMIFESLGEFKDSAACAQKCADILAQREKAQKAKKKKKKTIGILLCVLLVIIAIGLVLGYKFYIIPGHYNQGETALANQDYIVAIKEFTAAKGYQDSETILQGIIDEHPDAYRASLDVGQSFTFGSYNGNPIEWVILDKDGTKTLVISRNILCSRPFNSSALYQSPAKAPWKNSGLRSWLNGTFYNEAFTAEEASRILTTTVNTPDSNINYVVEGGGDTVDKVFLLSTAEASKYMSHIPSVDGVWWLRNPGGHNGYTAVVRGGQVNSFGISNNCGNGSTTATQEDWKNNTVYGPRPVMWLDLSINND